MEPLPPFDHALLPLPSMKHLGSDAREAIIVWMRQRVATLMMDPPPMPLKISDRLRQRLAGVRRLFVLTGAGISAESGIPTFRGQGGLWDAWKPEDYASPAAFYRNPARVWQWYLDRRRTVLAAQPNPGHRALAELESRLSEVMIATQNIDGLHQRAGSRRVVEIHGSIHHCRPTDLDEPIYPLDEIAIDPEHLPPHDRQGRELRPAVVWFSEMLPLEPIARVESFLAQPPDLTLIIGTQCSFQYIVDWALRGSHAGGMLIEVNPERTPITPAVDAFLQAPAGEALPHLCRLIGTGETKTTRNAK